MRNQIAQLLMSAALVFGTTAAATAQTKSDPVVIASGMEGGGYHRFATKMKERMGQRGFTDVTVMPTNGSDAITLAACNKNADVWIAQVDAVYHRYNEGCVLSPVADYGTEYAVLLFPPKSKLKSLSDLTQEHRIGVDGIGSGTELFWKTIVSIETGDKGNKNKWARAVPVESSPDTLNTMANFGDVDAAVLVRKADSDHIKLLMGQGWRIGYLWDKDIDDEQFNNRKLYEPVKVEFVPQSGKKQTNWVYEVRSFIGVSPEHANNRPFKMDVAASTGQ